MRLRDLLTLIDINNPSARDIFELLPESDITMKERHFELAVQGLRMNEKNLAAVKRVLVGNESRADVARDAKISKAQLGQAVNRVLAHFARRLEANGLVVEETIISKGLRPALDILEKETVKNHLINKEKKTKKREKR